MYSKRDLVVGLEKYLKTGFKPISSGPGVVRLKSKVSGIEIIFSYNKWTGSFDLGGQIVGRRVFVEVEDLLKKYYSKFGLKKDLYTIYISSRRFEKLINNKDYHIYNDRDIERIHPYFRTMVFEDVLPFLEKFETIMDVYEYSEGLDSNDIGGFIPNPMPLRRMILKGLLKTRDFEEYSVKILEYYKENSSQKSWGEFYPFVPDLYEDLAMLQ